ncbi:hypothetical protein ACLESD_00140 [Pyxidicoccus sp. 3LFB2]
MLERARLAVSGNQALLGMMTQHIVSMEETEYAMSVLHWDGMRWTRLGESSPVWPAQWEGNFVAFGAANTPWRVHVEQQGIAAERWNGQSWQRVLSGLGFGTTPGQPPACVTLLSGQEGLVLAWREGMYNRDGATYVGLLNPDTGTWEPLGEPLRPQSGQVFWSCPEFVLDAAGHPVLTWDENLLDSNHHTLVSEIRVARWDASSRGWKQLGLPFQAGAAPRVNWYPRVSVGQDDAPVVSWVAQPGRGQGLRTYRFNAADDTWEPLGTPAEPPVGEAFASVRGLFHDRRGRPVVCVAKEKSPVESYTQGMYCQRFEGGTWTPEGAQPLLSAPAAVMQVEPDAVDGLILLGGTYQSLRLYRHP